MAFRLTRSFIPHRVVSGVLIAAAACRAERVVQQPCDRGAVMGKWAERREPPAGAADTTRASLSLTLTPPPDSIDRLPPRTMISLVIAGPAGAERPDTVRLLAAETPSGPLWSGNDLRPGTYSASLTTDGFAAGPREFAVAGGERLQIDVAMGRTCDAGGATKPGPDGKAP